MNRKKMEIKIEMTVPTETLDAISQVFHERLRQIFIEGFNADHDDEHKAGELAAAAACYASHAAAELDPFKGTAIGDIGASSTNWPWHAAHWKPTGARRDLIKAAALILAEIEKSDRDLKIKAAAALSKT